MKFPQYVAAFLSVPNAVTDNEILPAFQVFDPDKRGVIEGDEILKSLTNVGEALNEAEAKAFRDNINMNDLGLFDYSGKETVELHVLFIFVSLTFRVLLKIYSTS